MILPRHELLMSENVRQDDSRLIRVEKDVEFLKENSVFHRQILEMMAPIKEQLLTQGKTIEQLGIDMSELSLSSQKTNETVDSVLKTYDQMLLRQAQAWGLSNVIRVMGTACGVITGIGGVGVLLYAAVKFVFKLP